MVHEEGDIFLHPSSLISSELTLNFQPSPQRDTQTVPQTICIPHIPDSSLDIVSGEYHLNTRDNHRSFNPLSSPQLLCYKLTPRPLQRNKTKSHETIILASLFGYGYF